MESHICSPLHPPLCHILPMRLNMELRGEFPFLPQDMAEQQENRTPTIVATVTALWVLSYIAVGGRVCGRFVGHTKLWWDDWLILLAAVCFSVHHP